MTVSVTIHLWYVLLYVGIGVVTVPVIAVLEYRRLQRANRGSIAGMLWRRAKHYRWKYPLWIAGFVLAWPLVWWEEVR